MSPDVTISGLDGERLAALSLAEKRLTREHRVTVTLFADKAAQKAYEKTLTFDQLAERIHDTHADTKDKLPLLKLGCFGGQRSNAGCLRTNENLKRITGVEGDYDDEEISLDEAKQRAAQSELFILLYTSPGCMPEHPRWRVLCPFSEDLPPDQRDRMMARLNGVFGGIFAPESWTLSQAYYYGRVNNPNHHCVVFEGTPIDLAGHLDATAVGRSGDLGDGEHVSGDALADIELIRDALLRVPNDGPAEWERWNYFGMGVFRATRGSAEGLELWLEWSARNPSFRELETRARWRNYRRSPPTRLGAGTIIRAGGLSDQRRLIGFLDLGLQDRIESALDGSEAASEGDDIAGSSQTAPEAPAQSTENGEDHNADADAEKARRFKEKMARAEAAGCGADGTRPHATPHNPQGQPEPPDEEEDEEQLDRWLDPIPLIAQQGLIGEAVAAIAPHTEADINGLLLQFLVRFGNKIGRGPHYFVEGAKHTTNIYVLLAGASSRARKDTSANRVETLFTTDPLDPWYANCCMPGGLSSGEGLIHAVRDEVWGKDKKGNDVLLDAGVADKRLLVVESEFASVLAVMKREGSILSPLLRAAWDRGNLRTLTKTAPGRATGALISIIGHITVPELREGLDRTAISNGLMNRFLFGAVRRARTLPFGGTVDPQELTYIGARMEEAIRAARLLDQVGMDEEAAELWRQEYPELTADKPGLFGSLIARAEAHVVRLALLYALADQATAIRLPHLQAAFAVWKYSEESARLLFGDLVGSPLADSLLVFLRAAGSDGLTRTELHRALNGHHSSAKIEQALQLLLKQRRVRRTIRITPGRPGKAPEVWIFIRRRSRP
jgi:hypothetical protein